MRGFNLLVIKIYKATISKQYQIVTEWTYCRNRIAQK